MAVGQKTLTLTHGHDVLHDFAPKFQKIAITAADAQAAVICEKERRSPYGAPQDLALIADVLIDTDSVPYHVIFAEALFGDQKWLKQLKRYGKIIILADGLRENCIGLVEKLVDKGRIFAVRQGEPNWQINLRKWLQE